MTYAWALSAVVDGALLVVRTAQGETHGFARALNPHTKQLTLETADGELLAPVPLSAITFYEEVDC